LDHRWGAPFAIGGVGLIVLIIIAVIALEGKGSSTGSGGQSASGSPKPCANADRFTVSVSGLNRNAAVPLRSPGVPLANSPLTPIRSVADK